MSKQYEKTHATTVTAAAALLPNRFIAANGSYASGASGGTGPTDALGVSEAAAAMGDAVPVVTGYSYPVELDAAVAAGQYVKPGNDGKAAVGSATDRCGIALEAGAAGDFVEVRLLQHTHP